VALTGDQAGTDVNTCAGEASCGRPMFPALFITDVTADPSSTSGDWQFGATPIPPTGVPQRPALSPSNLECGCAATGVTPVPLFDKRAAQGTEADLARKGGPERCRILR
jgi:hypothetical protein